MVMYKDNVCAVQHVILTLFKLSLSRTPALSPTPSVAGMKVTLDRCHDMKTADTTKTFDRSISSLQTGPSRYLPAGPEGHRRHPGHAAARWCAPHHVSSHTMDRILRQTHFACAQGLVGPVDPEAHRTLTTETTSIPQRDHRRRSHSTYNTSSGLLQPQCLCAGRITQSLKS